MRTRCLFRQSISRFSSAAMPEEVVQGLDYAWNQQLPSAIQVSASASINRMYAILSDLTPEQQLAAKQRDMMNYVCHVFASARVSKNGRLLQPFVPAPTVVAYRTKGIFGIAFDHQGMPAVGPTSRGYREVTSNTVYRLQDCLLITYHPAILETVSRFHCFIDSLCRDNRSELFSLQPFDSISKTGFYRLLRLRVFASGIEAVVSVDADFHHSKSDLCRRFKQLLAEWFFSTSDQSIDRSIIGSINQSCSPLQESFNRSMQPQRYLKPCSLFYEEIKGNYNLRKSVRLDLLAGSPYGYDELTSPFDDIRIKFRISPRGFFPIHRSATEAMYKAIAEFCPFDPKTTVLLDICCGVGTVGLLFAPRVQKLIGIDICEHSIEDARFNAEANSSSISAECQYFAGTVEVVLSKLVETGIIQASLDETSAFELVAFVDPNRQGLSESAMKVLRRVKLLKRIIYISCHKKAHPNFIQLCRRSGRSKAFRIKGVIPCDTFPLTNKYEMVFVFERN